MKMKKIAVVAAGDNSEISTHYLSALEQALQEADKAEQEAEHHSVSIEIVAVGGGSVAEEIVRQGLYRGAQSGVVVCDPILEKTDTSTLLMAATKAIEQCGRYDEVICEPSDMFPPRPQNARLVQQYKRAIMAVNRSAADRYAYLYDKHPYLTIPTLSAEEIGLKEEDLHVGYYHIAPDSQDPNSEGQTIVKLDEIETDEWAQEVARILFKHRPSRSPRPLPSANIVVGGGYGMGSEEGFEILYTLANEVKGRVGATRAAVDADLCPAKLMIGPTGVRIKPKVYLACGISGQIQHLAGIADGTTIISINTDIEAPINERANYIIVGTVEEAIPAILSHYKALLATPKQEL